MSRPILLLDVDGCLSPWPGLPDDYQPGILDADAHFSQPVRFDCRVPRWLAELGEYYDLAWGSTWEDMANWYLSEPLGLPALDYVPFVYGPRSTQRARKLAPVLAYLDQWPDRPAAWIDDFIGVAHQRAFAARQAPSLALGCRKKVGITQQHVDKLITFAKSLTDGPD